MPLSEEDKHLIQFYIKTRHLVAHHIIKLFPEMTPRAHALEQNSKLINSLQQ